MTRFQIVVNINTVMNNINKIQNGSLYFNESTKKVERVLGRINTQRVWTKEHLRKPEDTRIKDLRLANDGEVKSYKLKTMERHSLPALPTKIHAKYLPPLPKPYK